MNVLSGKAVQRIFIRVMGSSVLSSFWEAGEVQCRAGKRTERHDSSDSDHSSLLPESLTLGNPLDRTASGSGFVNYQ